MELETPPLYVQNPPTDSDVAHPFKAIFPKFDSLIVTIM